MRIAHASIDENNKTKNGEAGNQTGKEVCIREWYNKPWSVVLRYPDRKTREDIAQIAEKLSSAPVNRLIGYDQNERNSFHNVARMVDYNLNTFINRAEPVETDCSAFVTCICLFAGIKTLEYTGNAPTTSTMKATFKRAGFNILTDDKYVKGPDYLSKGDILLFPGSHTAICIDDGSRYGKFTVSYFPKCSSYHISRVDALKEIGVESSKDFRRKIYNVNYPGKYTADAKQNRDMLELLKAGRLIQP